MLAFRILAIVCFCCGLSVFGVTHAVAQSPPENVADGAEAVEDIQQRAAELLDALQSTDLQSRDAAEQALVELGMEVLELLPEVTSQTSGEMKIRLERIRQALGSKPISTEQLEPSTVSLEGKMSVSEAIDRISQQTGNAIEFDGEGSGTQIELNCVDETFWTVVGKIIAQADLQLATYGTTNDALVLRARGQSPGYALPAFTSGAFRVDPISARSQLAFSNSAAGRLEVSCYVSWEPRLKPVSMNIPMQTVKAVTGSDVELVAANPGASPSVATNGGGATTQIDLQLVRPERSETILKQISGELVFSVPGQSHKYQFEKFGSGGRQSEKFGDVTVTLANSGRNGAVYETRLQVSLGQSIGATNSSRSWLLSTEAYLLDAKDVRIENVGWRSSPGVGNSMGFSYLFQINGDPNDYKLVFELPGTFQQYRVPYQLDEIPLP